jgi:zinc transporter 1/2/3
MLDTVPFRSPWVDPGATAFDLVDGNLTSSIQSYGAGAVDTSVPTMAGGTGYVVEYAVEDRSRNAAPLARRLVRVVCPGQEQVCVDPDTSQPTCTVGGHCGRQMQVLSAFGTAAGQSASSAASSGSPNAAPKPPRLRLLGPTTVEVVAGTIYDRCGASVAPGAVCDPGADVEDDTDGNLVRQLLVCGNR